MAAAGAVMSLSESFSGELSGPIVSPHRLVEQQTDIIEQLTRALDGLFSVEDVRRIEQRRQFAVVFRGRLLGDAETLYPVIAESLKPFGYTATLHRQGRTDIVAAVEG